MAVSVRSSSVGTKTASGTFTVAKPAGTASGDLLVIVQVTDIFGTAASMTTPTGFTQWGSTYAGGGGATPNRGTAITKVWTRVADGSEGSTFSLATDDTSVGICLCVTGQDTTSPLNVAPTFSDSNSATAAQVAPSISPSVTGCLLICMAADTANSGSPTYTPDAAMTEQQDAFAAFVFASVDTQVLSASGSTGTRTLTCSITTINEATTMSAAIAPATGGGGAPALAPRPISQYSGTF